MSPPFQSRRVAVIGGGPAGLMAAETAAEIKATARELRASVQQVTEPAADFAQTGLPQVTTAVASLQEAADSVQRLTAQINASPTGLLTRRPARELEVPR